MLKTIIKFPLVVAIEFAVRIFQVLTRIRPLRVSRIYCERYGHLGKSTDLFFRRHNNSLIPNRLYIFLAPSKGDRQIANNALLDLYCRLGQDTEGILIIRSSIVYSQWRLIRKIFERESLWFELGNESNEKEFATTAPMINFSSEQIQFAESKLGQLGLDLTKPIVSIFLRDSRYLRELEKGRVDRSYHDYRNANIDNYVASINWLLSKGYQVVRIGSNQENPLIINKRGFVDYAFSDEKSDLLDLLIPKLSTFVMGSASGATDIATVLGVPYLCTDHAPFQAVPLGPSDIYLPKKIVKRGTKIEKPFYQYISLTEGIWNGNFWREKYDIEFMDNTPDEILSAVQEMVNRIVVESKYTEAEQELHQGYWNSYWVYNELNMPSTPISTSFLVENMGLFFDSGT